MNRDEPLLKVRFEGAAVGPGRISVSHLLRFLENLNKAFHRTGRILLGEAESVRRGPQPRSVADEIGLDLTLLAHGSPSTVLGFERSQGAPCLPTMDLGMDIIESAIVGLSDVQEEQAPLPPGCDMGVLMAWRDAGVLFRQGIARIEFTLNHRARPLVTQFTPEGFTRIQRRIQGPQTNIRTIEGRLLMADFKEHGTRCRVHPSVGEPVLCLFGEEQKEEVLEDILHYVRIVGEAKEDPATQKITSIRIHDIERIEDREQEAAELLPQGSPLPQDFWYSPTIEELALTQNVQPLVDGRFLFGTWPGELDDDFDSVVEGLRHQSLVGGDDQ